MRDKLHISKQELVNSVIALAEERITEDKQAEVKSFIRQFYENVAPQDILSETAEDLFGSAMSIWSFGKVRDQALPRSGPTIPASKPRDGSLHTQSLRSSMTICRFSWTLSA